MGEGLEVTEAEVRGGAVASECIVVAAADKDDLWDAEGCGAASHRPNVVALRHVVHHHEALYDWLFKRHGGGGGGGLCVHDSAGGGGSRPPDRPQGPSVTKLIDIFTLLYF